MKETARISAADLIVALAMAIQFVPTPLLIAPLPAGSRVAARPVSDYIAESGSRTPPTAEPTR